MLLKEIFLHRRGRGKGQNEILGIRSGCYVEIGMRGESGG